MPTFDDYRKAIAVLREGWNDARRQQVNDALTGGVIAHYGASVHYADAIAELLYQGNPSELFSGPRKKLSPADRQRCLVAVLASRRERFPLAIHTYIALMEAVDPEEIQNILFLVGVYQGVPSMVSGIDIELDVLEQLRVMVEKGERDPGAIIPDLKAKYST
jgi:alkylhydroperoxidase/carboxymuconolactone decarboxylase family protein YurZ